MIVVAYLSRELNAVQPEAALLVCLLQVRKKTFSLAYQGLHLQNKKGQKNIRWCERVTRLEPELGAGGREIQKINKLHADIQGILLPYVWWHATTLAFHVQLPYYITLLCPYEILEVLQVSANAWLKSRVSHACGV